MSEAAAQPTDVDPAAVDWEEVFIRHAGGVNETLGNLERDEAVQDCVAGITSEADAEELIGDAIEAGMLESRGDEIMLPDADTEPEVDPHAIDWAAVFRGAAGSVTNSFPSVGQGVRVNQYASAVSSQEEGKVALDAAVEEGIIERRGLEEGVDGAGLYLVDPPVDEDNNAGQEVAEVNDGDDLPEAVREMREAADTDDEYIGALEQAVGDLMKRVEEVESRQDRVENRQDRIFDQHVQQRAGLTEIQVERLKRGEILSVDGVDERMLEGDLGLDILRVDIGDGDTGIRLTDRHVEDDANAGTRGMPDFEKLCELEELRMKDVLGMRSRDDMKKKEYRAMAVWDDAEIIDVSDNSDVISIPSAKVKEKLRRICDDDVSEGTLNVATNRVMQFIPEASDGVFELETGNTNRLRADTDDLLDAKVSRFEKQQTGDADEGNDNTVVIESEGVTVSGQGDSP